MFQLVDDYNKGPVILIGIWKPYGLEIMQLDNIIILHISSI